MGAVPLLLGCAQVCADHSCDRPLADAPIQGNIARSETRIEVTATQLFTPDFTSLKIELVQKSALAILLLLAITILGVFKPWGLTSYGRRTLQQGGKTLRSVGNKVSSGVKAFVGVIVIFALLILILHLTGHGFGRHGR